MCINSNFSPTPFPTRYPWKHKTFPQHLTCPGHSTLPREGEFPKLVLGDAPCQLTLLFFCFGFGDDLDLDYLRSSQIGVSLCYPFGWLGWVSRQVGRSVLLAPPLAGLSESGSRQGSGPSSSPSLSQKQRRGGRGERTRCGSAIRPLF